MSVILAGVPRESRESPVKRTQTGIVLSPLLPRAPEVYRLKGPKPRKFFEYDQLVTRVRLSTESDLPHQCQVVSLWQTPHTM